MDGVHQQDMVIVNPGYPDPFGGGASQQVLPPSKYLLADELVMPKRALGLVALTQQLSQTFGLNVSYSHTNGWDRFRGRNVNAPLNGVTARIPRWATSRRSSRRRRCGWTRSTPG